MCSPLPRAALTMRHIRGVPLEYVEWWWWWMIPLPGVILAKIHNAGPVIDSVLVLHKPTLVFRLTSLFIYYIY